MKESIAILCGGGPAPGINTVISSVAKTFLRAGYRVLGIHGGFKGLFEADPRVEEFSFIMADRIHHQGGSALQMSRFKPQNEDFSVKVFVENNVKLLVTIGGDDTASTANRISEYLKKNNVDIKNIHVPKTIDNDLPLPEGIPTFGYQSAKNEGVRIASTVYEDARTSGNWFVVTGMGREAGHLAFGIGAACQYPMIIVPEMFNKTRITFEKIINMIISAIIKRKLIDVDYGVVMISEGVFHFVTDAEIKSTGINFTFDAHGHPELGNVSKAHIFNLLLQRKLKKLGLKVKSRPVELGYEIRSSDPIAFDLMYCRQLGIGVKKLFDEGHTGCMVMTTHTDEIKPLFLSEVAGDDGKVKTRLLNMDSDKVKTIMNEGMQYLDEEDYNEAKQYVDNPEEFDFRKILDW
ncbi:MAG: 6-phosphofructokinase [Bacteroidales bacterium]|nr:6-phosphofructokinase [Bacteroidales bacterium]